VATEFIEIHNVSASPVPRDDGAGRSWRIRGAIEYLFPLGITIPAGGYALIIAGVFGGDAAAEAAAFRTARGVPAAVPIFVYNALDHGQLDNAGEKIYLEQPNDAPLGTFPPPYILIDAVNYDDESPWPTLADGGGPSLAKIDSAVYGNDVNHWATGSVGGTPGSANDYIDTTPPSAPVGLAGKIISTTQVRLRWNEAADPQSGVAEYRIYRDNVLVGTSPLGVFTDSVAFSTTPLAYQVSAVNRDGFESTRSSAIGVGGQTISFQDGVAGYGGTRDATLRQGAADSATGTTVASLEIDGDDGGTDLAAVLMWQLSGVPAGAIVVAASIGVNVIDPSSNTYPVYVLRRDWVESEVTWNRASAAAAWGQPGASAASDRDAQPVALAGAGSGNQAYQLDAAGVAAVQAWLDGTSGNYGFIIADTSPTDGLDLDAREATNVANRPKLTISYLLPIEPPLSGDLDDSGSIDAGDIDFLRAAIAAGSADPLFDLDDSAAVNDADVDYLVRAILNTEYGDINLDGRIDRADAAILSRNFGTAANSSWSAGDLNGDGRTSLADAAILQSQIGFMSAVGSPVAAAPAAVTARSPRAASRGVLSARIVDRALDTTDRVATAEVVRERQRDGATDVARRRFIHLAAKRPHSVAEPPSQDPIARRERNDRR
jgi:hypothetical protein